MSARVTVTLPDGVLAQAEAWAHQAGRPLAEFLAETIAASLAPLGDISVSPEGWADADVLAALEDQLSPGDDERLSVLLRAQSDGTIAPAESIELHRLMVKYQRRLLRKSAALREAVRRGLRPAPAP